MYVNIKKNRFKPQYKTTLMYKNVGSVIQNWMDNTN